MPTKFYAVARGRQVGIFDTWPLCQTSVVGFSSALFKSFSTRREAEDFVARSGNDSARTPGNTGVSPGASSAAAAAAYSGYAGGGSSYSSSSSSTPSGMLLLTPAEDRAVGFVLRFDGACQGNPGPGGAGALLYGIPSRVAESPFCYNVEDEEGMRAGWTPLWRGSQSVGSESSPTTNNIAEYSGLLLGLRSLLRLGAGKPATARGGGERAWSGGGSGSSSSPPCSVVLVQGDSNLIIQQVKGENAVKKDHLQELHRQALGLQRQLEDRGVKVLYSHVLRDKNKEADCLSNEPRLALYPESQQRNWVAGDGLLLSWGLSMAQAASAAAGGASASAAAPPAPEVPVELAREEGGGVQAGDWHETDPGLSQDTVLDPVEALIAQQEKEKSAGEGGGSEALAGKKRPRG